MVVCHLMKSSDSEIVREISTRRKTLTSHLLELTKIVNHYGKIRRELQYIDHDQVVYFTYIHLSTVFTNVTFHYDNDESLQSAYQCLAVRWRRSPSSLLETSPSPLT